MAAPTTAVPTTAGSTSAGPTTAAPTTASPSIVTVELSFNGGVTDSQLDSIKNSLAATLNVSPPDISLTIKTTLIRETTTIVVAKIETMSPEQASGVSDSLEADSFKNNFNAELDKSGSTVDLDSVSTPTVTNGN